MISYEPFWRTLRKNNISQYHLIRYHNISKGLLNRIKKGEHITTFTIERFCIVLKCRVEDILEFK